MNPQAVTVGARVARRLTPIILVASANSPDRPSFLGGVLCAIAGGVAGAIGPQTTAELLRIALGRLEGTPQLELPPGVRLAVASAQGGATAAAQSVDEITRQDAPLVLDVVQAVNDDQLEAMRRVLAVVAAWAGIDTEELIGLLDRAIADVRAGEPPAPIEERSPWRQVAPPGSTPALADAALGEAGAQIWTEDSRGVWILDVPPLPPRQ